MLFYCWLGYEIKQGTKHKADGTHDYAIILGAKVKPGGVPSQALANRLHAAVEYLNTYPQVQVIVSGGQGPDEDRTEASVMQAYLIEYGISEERILLEDQSTSTYENLLYSKELLPDHETAVTIISNDFHLRRASFIAEKVGLQSDTVAAKTPPSVTIKLHARERLALVKTWIVGE